MNESNLFGRAPEGLIAPRGAAPGKVEAAVYRAVLPEIDEGAFEVVPIERAETIPASWYTHPAFHAFDRDAVIARSWQYVGHEVQLGQAGSYLAANVAGNPIVVVRGKDGVLRAFYNVCRHRGGPLVMDEHGCANVFQCKYHGWTYLLDGTLRGVPRFDRAELFDRRDYGLVPIRLETWHGLVFICLAEKPLAPLSEVVGGIATRIAPLRIDDLSFYQRVTYDVACNWKIYTDNYLEGYHIPLVHPELMQVLDYRNYATEIHPWYSLQHSLFYDEEGRYSAEQGEAYYYHVFPNIMLNVLPGRLQVNVVEPVAPDRTRVVFDYLYADVSSREARAHIQDDLAFGDRVQQEDIEICQHVQRGLSSAAYDRGRFSVEAETGVYHFQTLLKKTYRAALEG